MREIKFRAKDTGGEWHYGDLELPRNSEGNPYIHAYKENGEYDRQYPINDDTIGQFTGLYDKNGREIYEGDIIHLDCVGNFIVGYNKEFCSFELRTQLNDGGYVDKLWSMDCKRYEIVGNIYDNYKLLNKE